MRGRLIKLLDTIRASFWFVPTIMLILAVILAEGVHFIEDHAWVVDAADRGLIYAGGTEGARSLLNAIASSMISIAGVVFSITIVVLSLASNNLGPRLIRSFMQDRANQVVLGTFVATYVYCLLTLRVVDASDGQIYVPHLAVTVGIVLAMASMLVLVYFIHHMARSIQVPVVVHEVSKELDAALDHLYPEGLGEAPPAPVETPAGEVPDDFDQHAQSIHSHSVGYVQIVSVQTLLALATEHDLVLRMAVRPGDFIHRRAILAHVYPAQRSNVEIADEMRKAITTGSARTSVQDAKFLVDQITEIAIRALSPGINDPFTAMSCLDQLDARLIDLANRNEPTRYRFDEEGDLRVITHTLPFEDMLVASFRPILLYAVDSTIVLEHMLALLHRLPAQLTQSYQREALDSFLAEMQQICATGIDPAHTREQILAKIHAAQEQVEAHQRRS